MNGQPKQTQGKCSLSYDQLIKGGLYEQAFRRLKVVLQHKKAKGSQLTNLDTQKISELSNLIAMKALKQNRFEKAELYLKRAEKYSRHSLHMELVTHNNWSCLFKKLGNSNLALIHIQKAIALAKLIEKTDNKNTQLLADCYLNLCAVLSSLGDHQTALSNAQNAIYLIEDQMETFIQTYQTNPSKIKDRKNVLLIAKFNRATELQHLRRYDQSREEYQSVKDFIKENFDGEHGLLANTNKALGQLMTKLRTTARSCTTRHFSSLNTYQDHKFPCVLRQNSNNTIISLRKTSISKVRPIEKSNQERGVELRRHSFACVSRKSKMKYI